jgi:hypothetical protein
MKAALILGGQPRFTEAFNILMSQLNGIEQADIYACFWATAWARTAEEARAKIEPILLPGFTLKEIEVVAQPKYQLPPHTGQHYTEEKESVRWWYKRRLGMWTSIRRAFDLIKDDYDVIIRCRPDGRLDKTLDISSFDLSKGLIYPAWPRNGWPGGKICDQFAFGLYSDMRFYTEVVDHINNYIPEVCDYWESNVHDWASEHMLNHHLVKHGVEQIIGDFGHVLKGEGRSNFDDKDLHLGIGNNPTL